MARGASESWGSGVREVRVRERTCVCGEEGGGGGGVGAGRGALLIECVEDYEGPKSGV